LHDGKTNLTSKYTSLCSKLRVEKLGEIVAATNYKRKMHSRLKFLAYLHLICASSIFWPEFSAAQQQQQQQAASLTEKIPLGESQKRRQRIPRILPLLPLLPKKEQAKLSLTLHLWMGLAIVVVAIYTPPLLCVIPGMDSLVSSHGSFGKLGMADAQRLSLTFPSLSCPSAQSILHDF